MITIRQSDLVVYVGSTFNSGDRLMFDVARDGVNNSICTDISKDTALEVANALLAALGIGQVVPNIIEIVETKQEGYKLV